MSTLTAAPRRPWLAALLSAVPPGFGQFYVGDANRTLGTSLAFALLGIPAPWQTRTVYASVSLLTTLVVLPAVIAHVPQHLLQAFHIPSDSMSPTLVLGDNLDASRDSRHFDDVPLSDVVGRPRQVWFSHGERGVRWDRIGRAVQGAARRDAPDDAALSEGGARPVTG